MASLQTSAASAVSGVGSTGQSLQGGAASTGTSTVAPSLLQSSPSSQFAASALSFLTALQDPRSAAASAVQATASVAVGQASSVLSSALNALSQALDGSSTTASASATSLASLASTASAGASSLAGGTSSTLLQALDQLSSALGSSGAHHRHHGDGSSSTAAAQVNTWTTSASASPLSLTAGVNATV